MDTNDVSLIIGLRRVEIRDRGMLGIIRIISRIKAAYSSGENFISNSRRTFRYYLRDTPPINLNQSNIAHRPVS